MCAVGKQADSDSYVAAKPDLLHTVWVRISKEYYICILHKNTHKQPL